jgi:hypothetical protein
MDKNGFNTVRLSMPKSNSVRLLTQIFVVWHNIMVIQIRL